MSLYKQMLPAAFPFALEMPREDVLLLVDRLTAPDRLDGLPGSSFAVTEDTFNDDTVILWMSQASAEYLGFDD